MKVAVILGAGFSYAIAKQMPLTPSLGDLVLDRVEAAGVPVRRRPGDEGFETWLSRLAEPQPDLSTAQNLENQALFAHVAIALSETILAQQQLVLGGQPPWWLRRLVGALHYGGDATIVTFNYDMLVEYALEWGGLRDSRGHHAGVDSALRYGPTLPYRPPTGLMIGSPHADTFELLKLHGSVDSYWVPGDQSGATINRWDSGARWEQPVIPSDNERRQVLPGREPFLIPPAAAKSAFYANPVSRELWRRAADAIGAADEVAVVGYSLPLTDLVTAGMLGDQLRNSTSRIAVVNPDAANVIDALARLGVDPTRTEQFTDSSTGCSQYAERLERRFRPSWSWPGLGPDASLAVGETTPEYEIDRIESLEDDIVTLRVSDAVGPARGPVSGPTVQHVQAAASSSSPRVRLLWPDGNESWTARTQIWHEPSGAIEGLLFIPTAKPKPAAP